MPPKILIPNNDFNFFVFCFFLFCNRHIKIIYNMYKCKPKPKK